MLDAYKKNNDKRVPKFLQGAEHSFQPSANNTVDETDQSILHLQIQTRPIACILLNALLL